MKQRKEKGVPPAGTPYGLEELPLLRGLFLSALSLLRHWVFSSGGPASASDSQCDRRNGWAEPSTLIPDVDYG